MNIVIFAALGHQNLGDELIVQYEIQALEQEFSQARCFFRVASYTPAHPFFQKENVEYFEYFPIAFFCVKNIFRNIRNLSTFVKNIFWSDIVVIGGGGLFYDRENQSVGNPLKQWIFRVFVARFFRKKIYFYAVGIDVHEKKYLSFLQYIFKKAWKVCVRDTKSAEILSALGITSIQVEDPVFAALHKGDKNGMVLSHSSPQNLELSVFEEMNFQDYEVGIAFRAGYLDDALLDRILQAVESRGGKIIFLPHSIHEYDSKADDASYMKKFLTRNRRMYTHIEEVHAWYTSPAPGTKKILFSMRLHSMILAYCYGIAQIAVSYSQKTDEFLKKICK